MTIETEYLALQCRWQLVATTAAWAPHCPQNPIDKACRRKQTTNTVLHISCTETLVLNLSLLAFDIGFWNMGVLTIDFIHSGIDAH